MRDFYILFPFNPLFFLIFSGFAVVFLVLSLCLRKCREAVRRWVLSALMLVTLAGFFVYKWYLSMDAEFSALTAAAGCGGFCWWGELPFQLCNINMILIPIAALTKKRSLMSFSFFLGPLGAFMALALPGVGFSGYSLLLPRMLGYWGTHFMVFFGGLSLCSFGLYTPSFRDFPKTLISAVVLSFGIFLLNMAMRLTGLHPHANYFFCVETEGNSILELFHSIIPVPFLYILPCVLVLLPYMCAVTLPFSVVRRRRSQRRLMRKTA